MKFWKVLVGVLAFGLVAVAPVFASSEEIKIINESSGPGNPPYSTFTFSSTFLIPYPFSNVFLTYGEFDDNGDLYINWFNVYSNHDGQCVWNYDILNTEITNIVHIGFNTVLAYVDDSCGGYARANASITVYYSIINKDFNTSNNPAELSSIIPYIGPQLGTPTYGIYTQNGSNGFNLTISNFGDATANNTYGNVTIFWNETEETEIFNNASIEASGEEIVWVDTNVTTGKYNMTVSLDYADPVVDRSFSREINATLIVGNVTTPVNIPVEPTPVFYENQSVVDGLNYLVDSQNVDGGWGDNGSDILTTTIVMDALVTADGNTSAIDSGFNYTESKLNESFEDVGLTARMVLNFLKANRSASRVDEAISWIESMENEDGGHGYNGEFRSNAMDTLLAAKVIDTGSWLVENIENATWDVFDETDILLTAEAMSAISGDVNDGELNLSETANFLKTRENLNFIEKCGVLSALSKVNDLEIIDQLSYEIEGNQSGNGSFGSIAQTAYAVSSLISFYSVPFRTTILSPQNSSYNVASFELNYSVKWNVSWVAYSLDGQPNVTLAGNTNLTNLSEGQHLLTVFANDTAGIMVSSTVYFTVDTVFPIITITYPQNNTYTVSSVPLNVSASENIGTWKYSLNGGNNVTFSPNVTILKNNWWNPSWFYASWINITNTNNIDIIPVNYSYVFSFNSSALISAGKLRANGTDLRVVCNDVSLEWKNLTSMNDSSVNTSIAFGGVYNLSILAGSSNASLCRLYYGNPDAPDHDSTIGRIYYSPVTWEPYDNQTTGTNIDGWEAGIFDGDTGSYIAKIVGIPSASDKSARILPDNSSQGRRMHRNFPADDKFYVEFDFLNDKPWNNREGFATVGGNNEDEYHAASIVMGLGDNSSIYGYYENGNHLFTTPVLRDGDWHHWKMYYDAVTDKFDVWYWNGTDYGAKVQNDGATRVNLASYDNIMFGADENSWYLDNFIIHNSPHIEGDPELTLLEESYGYELLDDSYYVAVYANDAAENTNSSAVYFTVDATPPTITVDSPANTTYLTNSVDLNYSVSDLNGVDWIGYSLNGADNTTLLGNITLTNLTDDQHDVIVYANDTFGNTNSSVVYFIVDTTPPAITIDSPTNTTYLTASVDMNVSADEIIDIWMYSLDGGNNVTFSPNITLIGGENWWNSSWQHRQTINITNNNDSAVLREGYAVNITVDHSSLVSSGKTLANGSDMRVVWQPNASYSLELDRINATAFNSSSTEIWFKLQENISSGGWDANYSVYYGNPSAGAPPTNGSNVGMFYDDFDTDDWTDTGSMVYVDAISEHLYAKGDRSGTDHHTSISVTPSDDFEIEFIYTVTAFSGNGFQSLLLGIASADENGWTVDNFLGIWLGYNAAVGGHTIYAHYRQAGNPNSVKIYNPSLNTDYIIVLRRIGVTLDVEVWNSDKSSKLSSYQWIGTNLGTLDYLLASNYNDGAGATYWIEANADDWKYKKYFSPEPTTSLGVEEIELGDDAHNAIVYAVDTAGNMDSSTVYFTVNSTPYYNISLIPGWNMISIPLEQDNWSITSVLASIEGNYTDIYAYVNGMWYWDTSLLPFFKLTDMAIDQGYWINMSTAETLELNGTVPSSTTISVVPKWNLVGYPTFSTQNITTVLSSIGYTDVYTYKNGLWYWDTSLLPFFVLTEMTTGQGFWINGTSSGSYEVGN